MGFINQDNSLKLREKVGDITLKDINPISRLYKDMITILNSIIIKYSAEAEKNETFAIKSKADRYINAILLKDNYYMYDDYTIEDFNAAGVTDPNLITSYQNNRFSVPTDLQSKLILIRREREIEEYAEENNYYRMLNGYPDLEDTSYFYIDPLICEEYEIPKDIPIHEIADKLGTYYINVLEGIGYIDQLIKDNPDKKYLHHLGSKRISIQYARNAKNFAILKIQQEDVMESTYREFIRCYEKARIYFMSTCYVYQYRRIIPYYDNFIGLCIFVMAIQQVSMRSIKNAVDREFYDEYMVQLLYETYGVPYFSRVDETTQKLIVQNLNLLVQNKATNKVILDIASILGFNDINIYQYYLIKKRRFDKNGRPVIVKKKQVNTNTGKVEEVYDDEAMNSVYFQKVDIRDENVKDSLTNTLQRVEYHDITYYDPFWWEDDDLHNEIWKTAYNYMETKYMGITVPYRLTELLFQSVLLLKLIMEKQPELYDVTIQLPKITSKAVSLPMVVVLFFALMSKKCEMSGQILTLPSKLIHILETTDQEINKENDHIEVLGFNFDAFSPANLKKTVADLERHLSRRKYRIVGGHDVDLNEDGTQNTFAPTHKIQYTVETKDLEELYKYITDLSIPGKATTAQKVKSLNGIYDNIEALYYFLSYQISCTNNMEEYYALKTLYDTAFYSKETAEAFKVTDEDGVERTAETFLDYLYYKDKDLYEFVNKVEKDQIYSYIDHIIYKMEALVNNVGYLYIRNDGFSPLMELLQILVVFFKSYTIDFVDMTSLMVVDWDLENTIRFFSHPQHISKVDQIETRFGKEFMDVLNSYLCRYRIEDRIALSDYIKTHATLHIKDEVLLQDMMDFVHAVKVDAVNEEFYLTDSVGDVNAEIYEEEDISLEDVCVKKVEE